MFLLEDILNGEIEVFFLRFGRSFLLLFDCLDVLSDCLWLEGDGIGDFFDEVDDEG